MARVIIYLIFFNIYLIDIVMFVILSTTYVQLALRTGELFRYIVALFGRFTCSINNKTVRTEQTLPMGLINIQYSSDCETEEQYQNREGLEPQK